MDRWRTKGAAWALLLPVLAACGDDATGPGSAVVAVEITAPTSAVSGDYLTSLTVTLLDDGGNTVSSATDEVTLQLTTRPSGSYASLRGRTTVAAVDGVATFDSVTIDGAGNDFEITAYSGAADPDVSTPIDITGPTFVAGTTLSTVSSCDDCLQGGISIGFDFSFYDSVYTDIGINSNGLITFGPTCNTLSNSRIPSLAGCESFIAPFWDDMNPSNTTGSGDVYYATVGTAPNRSFVVEWRGVARFANNGSHTFNVILHEGSGDVEFQYASMSGAGNVSLGSGATIGFENQDATEGLEVAVNTTGAVETGRVMYFEYDPVEGNYVRVR